MHSQLPIFLLLTGAAYLAAPGGDAMPPARAQEIDQPAEYRKCMALARRNPEQGFEQALSWGGLGGGDASRHCAAVALFGLGQYAEAARRLTTLADTVRADAAFKAELLGQAGQAWLLADRPAAADRVLSTALKLAPGRAALLIGRARAAAAQNGYFDAIDDLNAAIDADPSSSDAYVYRASAYRLSGNSALAGDDIERALKLAPKHIEALLERGILRRLAADKPGARQDWLKVIEIAPDSAAARVAQANLERMDGPGR